MSSFVYLHARTPMTRDAMWKGTILLLLQLAAALLVLAGPCRADTCRLLLQEQPQTGSTHSVTPSNCTPPHSSAQAIQQPFCSVPSPASAPAQQVLHAVMAYIGPLALDPGSTIAELRANATAWNNNALSGINITDYIQARRNVTLGGVPSVIATPAYATSNDTALFWLHGGGYFFGSCYTNQLLTVAAVAEAGGIAILCPEYRLSPENPFPAGLNDSVAAYEALVQQYSPKKVVVVGDSAGGGLVMALLQRLHQQGLPMPAAVGLLSPWVDLAAKGDTINTLNGVDPVLVREFMTIGTTGTSSPGVMAFVGNDTSKLQDPLVSPVYANYTPAAIGQLPPILIQVGLREVLLSDSVNLYRALVRAGQPATISPWDGMWHIFPTFQTIPEAQEASREMAAFFKRAMS